MKAHKAGLGIVTPPPAGKTGAAKDVQAVVPDPSINPLAEQRNNSGFNVGADAAKPTTSAPVSTEKLELKAEQREAMAKIKGTCPFIGTAMATGALPIRNTPDKPLASIDDVVALGNSGGGNLGNLFRMFALGNHAVMVGDHPGKLDLEVPPGMFSLDLAGSQGSHPGHSGILNGNPLELNAGRFSDSDWARLEKRAVGGFIKQSEVGKFIAENLHKDPNSKVFGAKTAARLGIDLLGVVGYSGPALLEGFKNAFREHDTHEAQRDMVEKLTKLLGEDNLVGSAGEFALKFAFLKNGPNAKEIDGEPAVAFSDLTLMFKEHRFPEGWETWPKNTKDWVASSFSLTLSAGKEYLRLKHDHGDNGVI